MRINEFSNAAGIDGTISSTEQTRFLLFGFDLALPVVGATFVETLAFNSLITTELSFGSAITTELSFGSAITTTLEFNSPIGD